MHGLFVDIPLSLVVAWSLVACLFNGASGLRLGMMIDDMAVCWAVLE